MSTLTAPVHRVGVQRLWGWLERELGALPGRRSFDLERIMRCEEYREPGRLVVRAELPGIDPERDVEVTVGDGLLRIRAHRREERRDRRRSEFFYGEMIRTLLLPVGFDEEGIGATYKDGILEVEIPVSAPSPTTTVPVIRLD